MACVRHLNKVPGGKAVHRGMGSAAILAAARVGLLAAPHPKETGRFVLAPTKSNIGPLPPADDTERLLSVSAPATDWLDSLLASPNPPAPSPRP